MDNIEIKRRECEELRRLKGWTLVYGRRKVGKTWLIRRCIDWDGYMLVTKGGECILEIEGTKRFIEVEDGLNEILKILVEGGTAIIDEFQRIPPKYWDLIAHAYQDASGRLILCGSSHGIVNKVFDNRSPLLGVVNGFKMDVASVADTIYSLHNVLPPREAVLWSTIARDPWIIRHLDLSKPPYRELHDKAEYLIPAVEGLVGEVFLDEDRRLTRLYMSVLRQLALGEWSISKIAGKLYSSGVIPSGSPSYLTGILDNMERMGLVKKIPLWKTRRAKYYYMHRSSAIALLMYIDEATAGLQYDLDLEALRTRYSIELQFTIGELLAEYTGYRQAYTVLPEGGGDIDILLLDREGRPKIAYEVKIGEIETRDIRRWLDKVSRYGIGRYGLITLSEDIDVQGLDEVLNINSLISIAKEIAIKKRSLRN